LPVKRNHWRAALMTEVLATALALRQYVGRHRVTDCDRERQHSTLGHSAHCCEMWSSNEWLYKGLGKEHCVYLHD